MSSRIDIQTLADQLERLAGEARAAAEAPVAQGGEAGLGDAERRLHAQVDRAVASATRVLDRIVADARLAVTRAEQGACERILETTRRACERIEAADRAQERLLEVIAETRQQYGPGA
jgi:hypothetical protein